MKYPRLNIGLGLILILSILISGCIYSTQTPIVELTPADNTPVNTQSPPSPTPVIQPTLEPLDTEIPVLPTETPTESPDQLSNVLPIDQNVLFWYFLPPQSAEDIGLNQIVDQFNLTNSEGIFIDAYNLSTSEEIVNQIFPLLNTSAVPALITTNPEIVYRLSEGLTDLTPFISSKSRGINQTNLQSAWLDMLQQAQLPGLYQGFYGFPLLRKANGIYSNLSWLTKLGYTEEPRTSQELADMACRSAREPFSEELNQSLTGMQIQPGLASFALLTYAFGGALDSPDSTTYNFNSPQAIEAMDYLQKYAILDCFFPSEDQEAMLQSFANIITSLLVTDTDILPRIDPIINGAAGFEWAFFGFPSSEDQSIISILPGLNFSIPKQTPEQMVAAWEFIKYFHSAEAQSIWSNASGNIPLYRYEESEIEMPEPYNQIFSGTETLKIIPSFVEYDQINSAVALAMISIMGGSPVEETLETLQQSVNEISAAFFKTVTNP